VFLNMHFYGHDAEGIDETSLSRFRVILDSFEQANEAIEE